MFACHDFIHANQKILAQSENTQNIRLLMLENYLLLIIFNAQKG
jgi:hypothetical protein